MFNENMPTCPIFFDFLGPTCFKDFPMISHMLLICFLYVSAVVAHISPISRVFPVFFPFLHGFPISSIIPIIFHGFPIFFHGFPKAVVWYAGATASQIERSITKAAGLGEAPIECRDGEDVAPWANIS